MKKNNLKKLIIPLAVACIITLTSCGGNASGIFGSKGDSSRMTVSQVHTIDEMVAFAQNELNKKYSKSFVLEENTLQYSDNSNNPRLNNDLTGFAHVDTDSEARCYFIVEEPGTLKDNYSFCIYKKQLADKITPDLKEAGLDGTVEAYYDATEKVLPENMDLNKVLHDSKCEIGFTAEIENYDTADICISIIRKWMDYLYPLDYVWYFELRDKEGHIVFSLAPDDRGYSSEEEWSDTDILGHLDL